ncbi:MAG: ChbG/HpnK family deacetylase [Sedimentisphaerales bacterium]|nr:ChbG/HpnK family deacetylase [Sedimentisphaerales bacterium]
MERKIIINADDFGLCDGVNRAVVQAHTQGILTSATIMANMPAARQAVELAKQLPTLGVGIHLNLFEGKPVSKDPCVDCLLDTNGQFAYSPARLSILSVARRKIRNAIATELAAQIQWVIDNGLKPTHLDSHKHIHSFPAIFPIVCDLAKSFRIAAIRWPFEPKQVSQKPWPPPTQGGRKRARIIRAMAKINRRQNPSFFKTQATLGIAHTGGINVDFLKAAIINNRAETVEIIAHPGFINGLDPTKTRLVQQRKMELDTLCDKKTKQYFKEAAVKLVHYGQI